ncbi:hypothetical protein [Hymenobacter coalescens]
MAFMSGSAALSPEPIFFRYPLLGLNPAAQHFELLRVVVLAGMHVQRRPPALGAADLLKDGQGSAGVLARPFHVQNVDVDAFQLNAPVALPFAGCSLPSVRARPFVFEI